MLALTVPHEFWQRLLDCFCNVDCERAPVVLYALLGVPRTPSIELLLCMGAVGAPCSGSHTCARTSPAGTSDKVGGRGVCICDGGGS
eukprot:354763-Chlamydomonas_euryale.AAC.4